jgi:transcriptional adapter 2-alpha
LLFFGFQLDFYLETIAGTPLDISQAPGFDLLSDQERDLCSQVRLFPHQYMVIKDTLLRESLKAGGLTKQIARTLVKIGTHCQ